MEAAWVVVLASGALLVRAGQMLWAIGLSRSKNVASAGFRGVADLCVATLCFWAIGASIHFQRSNGIFGIDVRSLAGWGGISPHWFSMLALVLIATAIVAPAIAERSRLGVPLSAGALLSAILVPLVGHWTWRGWLNQLGFVDLAGASAVHLVAASCAATAAIFVGAREGKYNRDGSSNMIPGHSVSLVILAAILMLIGWAPYVTTAAMMHRAGEIPGGLIAANVFISGAAGGLVSLIVGQLRFGKADVLLTIAGMLGGLVSISAGAASVGTSAAFLIGLVAGIIIPAATVLIDLRWKIDDPGGVIAIHGVGGIWALLAVAIFAPMPSMPVHPIDRLKQIGVQLLGSVVAIAISAVLTAIVMILVRSTAGLRSSEADEFDGLDLAEHDINAHPDFQQTMIKSYHLREA
jgi:Amt family ammonium transporter